MHVALVTHGLPQEHSNGGPMTCWAVMRTLLDRGHTVTVLVLGSPEDAFLTDERKAAVTATGAALRMVELAGARPARAAGAVSRVFGAQVAARPQVEAILTELAPDVAFVYHWDTLASTYGIRSVPRFAAVGDPWHLPLLRRWQATRPSPRRGYLQWTATVLRSIRPATAAMVELLNDADAAGCFQAHEARWLRERGARHCDYLPSPLVDPGEQPDAPRDPAAPFHILVGPSNLEATSTRAGLQLLGRTILPGLDTALGRDNFTLRIVGEGAPPPELAARLPHPSVALPGRVEPPTPELLAADAQLVPTPTRIGVRLRIVEAFSYGRCVVAHAAEAENLPELVDGENCLLGRSGDELVAQLVRLARDPQLQHDLGRRARAAYERHFHPDVAAAAIAERLERLAVGREEPAREDSTV
jgi:glycosyltransferase involved in cell wall biosynthesis